jgi:hypothetical protein
MFPSVARSGQERMTEGLPWVIPSASIFAIQIERRERETPDDPFHHVNLGLLSDDHFLSQTAETRIRAKLKLHFGHLNRPLMMRNHSTGVFLTVRLWYDYVC